MDRLRTGIFVVFMFFLTGTQVFGASREVFVDSSAGGGGSGSDRSPYNELSDIDWSRIQLWVNSGDEVTIRLKRGSVFASSQEIKASGAQGRPINIVAYGSGNLPIINGKRASSYGLFAKRRSYINFDSIKFTNQKLGGISLDSCQNINITNSYFTSNANGEGVRLKPNSGDVSSVTIQSSTFQSLDEGILIQYWGTGAAGYRVDGLTVDSCTFDTFRTGIHNWHEKANYTVQNSNGARTRNITISNNSFSNSINAAVLLNCKGGTNLISGNILTNIGDGSEKTNALQIGHAENLTIEYNFIDTVNAVVTGDGHAIIIDHYPAGYTSNDCDGVIVRWNWVTNASGKSSARGIRLWDGINSKVYGNVLVNNAGAIGASKAGNTGNVFYNNTMIQTSGSCINLDGGAYDLTETSTWKNNICVGGDYFFYRNNTGRVIEDHNLYYQTQFSNRLSPDASDINADPQFGGINSGDYRLSASSPAVGSGIELASKYADGLSPRTQWSKIPPEVIVEKRGISGKGWDVGAYVFSGATVGATEEIPNPPSNLSIVQ